ncbi:hypothetical protein GGC47_004524 [Bosea sp. OAE752]
MSNLVNVDETLAQRVAAGLGMALPKASKPAVVPADMEPSPALPIVGKYPDTLKGRSVGILVSDGADGTMVAASDRRSRARAERQLAPRCFGVTPGLDDLIEDSRFDRRHATASASSRRW